MQDATPLTVGREWSDCEGVLSVQRAIRTLRTLAVRLDQDRHTLASERVGSFLSLL